MKQNTKSYGMVLFLKQNPRLENLMAWSLFKSIKCTYLDIRKLSQNQWSLPLWLQDQKYFYLMNFPELSESCFQIFFVEKKNLSTVNKNFEI
jgi:hypothetical protein